MLQSFVGLSRLTAAPWTPCAFDARKPPDRDDAEFSKFVHVADAYCAGTHVNATNRFGKIERNGSYVGNELGSSYLRNPRPSRGSVIGTAAVWVRYEENVHPSLSTDENVFDTITPATA